MSKSQLVSDESTGQMSRKMFDNCTTLEAISDPVKSNVEVQRAALGRAGLGSGLDVDTALTASGREARYPRRVRPWDDVGFFLHSNFWSSGHGGLQSADNEHWLQEFTDDGMECAQGFR